MQAVTAAEYLKTVVRGKSKTRISAAEYVSMIAEHMRDIGGQPDAQEIAVAWVEADYCIGIAEIALGVLRDLKSPGCAFLDGEARQ